MSPVTFDLLKERFKENGFTNERLRDAINHVIDTYEGWDKLPNIANFIQYDKKVKIYTYKELLDKYREDYYAGATYDPISREYDTIEVNGQKKYARKEDIEKYHLK